MTLPFFLTTMGCSCANDLSWVADEVTFRDASRLSDEAAWDLSRCQRRWRTGRKLDEVLRDPPAVHTHPRRELLNGHALAGELIVGRDRRC